MTTTIAVAGKGGTGKTTFSALLIKYLVDSGQDAILAVDADPSSNLHSVLGLEAPATVGDIREEALQQISQGTFDASIPKPDYFEYKIYECLLEGDKIDLLSMGRPEGPGCYCAANSMLRECIDRLANDYRFVVIDNEAGMEHISRQTTRNMDILYLVVDPSMRSIAAAERIVALIHELGSRVKTTYLVQNRVKSSIPSIMAKRIDALGVPLVGTLPEDEQISTLDALGSPIMEISPEAPAYQAVRAIIQATLETS